jgi:hypothetical protein
VVRAVTIAMQQPSKQTLNNGATLFPWGLCRGVILKTVGATGQVPVWRRCRNLHRDPASRRRWRKGKSQIWDSKIRSKVPRDYDPRKTALARASGTCKRQTRPLVREGAPRNEERNCQTYSVFRTEKKISGRKPRMGALYQDRLADWSSVVT